MPRKRGEEYRPTFCSAIYFYSAGEGEQLQQEYRKTEGRLPRKKKKTTILPLAILELVLKFPHHKKICSKKIQRHTHGEIQADPYLWPDAS